MSDYSDDYQDSPNTTTTLPPIGKSDPIALRRWVDEGLCYTHYLNTRRYSLNLKAERFDQGDQWLQPASTGWDTGSPSQWISVNQRDSELPIPVFNEMLGARTNESTRLARPNYRPIVKASFSAQDLKIRTQVRNSQRALLHRLKQINWERTIDLICYHLPLYGGAWTRSEWVTRWDETITVPLESTHCPQCNATYASSSPAPLPQERGKPTPPLPQLPQAGNPCPDCLSKGMEVPLSPYQTSMEEASNKDPLGNPLGEPQPVGDWDCSIVSPYDIFPVNMGIDMCPGDPIPDITEARVVNLDYISLRWPDQAPNIRPENPATLAKYHPIAGAPNLYNSMMGTKFFANSTRLKSRHRRPWVEKGQRLPNKGRSVIMAGNEVLLDGPYLLDSLNYSGEFVPRAVYTFIPWEFKDGGRTLDGISQSSLLFDAQEGVNETRSQTQSVRQRMALPYYMVNRNFNLEVKPAENGVAGSFWYYDSDPTMPNVLPQRFNNETIDQGVAAEREDYLGYINRAALREVETGAVPPGADAGVTVRLLKEAAGEQRESRIKRIKTGVGQVFKHGADLQSHLYVSPRNINYMDDSGQEAWDVVTGEDLAHNPIVEAEPSQSDEDEQRLLIQTLVSNGIVQPAAGLDIRTKRKMAYILAGQTQQTIVDDIFENEFKQDKSAQQEFIAFRDRNEIPIVDPSLDDSATHYDRHGIDCLDDYYVQLAKDAGWRDALVILQPQWDQIIQMVTYQGMGQPAQKMIVQVWSNVLLQAGFQPLNPESFGRVLEWRAHMEAHLIIAQQKELASMMAPQIPAPGSAPMGNEGAPGDAAVRQATSQQPLVNANAGV